MWWPVILKDIGLIAIGGVFGFMTHALITAGRDADRQADLLQMLDDVRRDA